MIMPSGTLMLMPILVVFPLGFEEPVVVMVEGSFEVEGLAVDVEGAGVKVDKREEVPLVDIIRPVASRRTPRLW
jgi:hypothetical protein